MTMENFLNRLLDPNKYPIDRAVWWSLIINSRLRFHEFFKTQWVFGDPESEKHQKMFQELSPQVHSESQMNFQNIKTIVKIVYNVFLHQRLFSQRNQAILKKLSREKSQSIVVLKTFLYESSIKNNERELCEFEDPFFRNFTDYLLKNHNGIIFVDHFLENKKLSMINKIPHEKYPLTTWMSLVKLNDLIASLWLMVKNKMKFKLARKLILPKAEGRCLDHLVVKELELELFHHYTLTHLLFQRAVKNLVSALKKENCAVSKVIMTCENNGWEKSFIYGWRTHSPGTKIIGYQHSVVPPSAHGMKFMPIEIQENNLPDVLYTTGNETEKILKEFNANDFRDKIFSLSAFRYEYLFSLKLKTVELNKKILVPLEAIVQSADLIDVIINLEEFFQREGFQVTLRFHPALPYDFFVKNQYMKPIMPHSPILVSKNTSLEHELKEHDLIIYSGSTVALEGLALGNQLLSFDQNLIYSHDPLYFCNAMRKKFTSAEDLKYIILSMYDTGNKCRTMSDLQAERVLGQRYLHGYFQKPDESHYQRMLA